MSNRARFRKPAYIEAADMAEAVVGEWLNIEGIDNVSFVASWTGDPTGTFYAEVSNDSAADQRNLEPSGRVGAALITVPTGVTNPAGNDGSTRIAFSNIPERWMRLGYTPDGGAPGEGVLDVAAAGKGV